MFKYIKTDYSSRHLKRKRKKKLLKNRSMSSPVDHLVYNLQRDAFCLPQNIFKFASFNLLLRSFVISGCDFINHRPLAQQTRIFCSVSSIAPCLANTRTRNKFANNMEEEIVRQKGNLQHFFAEYFTILLNFQNNQKENDIFQSFSFGISLLFFRLKRFKIKPLSVFLFSLFCGDPDADYTQ